MEIMNILMFVYILLTCKSLEFAAQYYTAHFWGYGHRARTDYWIWQNGCLAGKLEKIY